MTYSTLACRVGHFFLFKETAIAITATISVENDTTKFIASKVIISGTPFPKEMEEDRRPPCNLLYF
jgi:hypothetical protein